MTPDDDVSETAIMEVKIGDQWLEWHRINRKAGEAWNGFYLNALIPETRVRIVEEKME